MTRPSFCRVVLQEATRQFDKEYTYAIPAELQDKVAPGSPVKVPFGRGNRYVDGWCIALQQEAPGDFYIKPIKAVKSIRPLLTLDQIELAVKMRQRYLCTYGAALRLLTPAAVLSAGDRKVRFAALQNPEEAAAALASGQLTRLGHIRVLQFLLDYGPAPTHELQYACQVSAAVLKTLEKNGFINFYRDESRRELTEDKIEFEQEPDFVLKAAQQEAVDQIEAARQQAAAQGGYKECLLYGITGSGKTEVYLQSAGKVLAAGLGVIILVPEIALTPQMVSRIRARFGKNVALLHSRLTPAERYEHWQRILQGEVHLVVGARSAIFAPLNKIGLIVLDEEQESTYKSETHPRYHAADIARMRAHMHNAVLLLGSATPSVESFYRTQQGHSQLLCLPERIGSAGLADTLIADMREELKNGNRTMLSSHLHLALEQVLAKQKQAMIFLNRRGYARFVLCRSCGYVVKCKSCSVSLTSHYFQNHSDGVETAEKSQFLICHYCGKVSRLPRTCPACGSNQIGRFGVGTQQVEEYLKSIFPQIRTLRMDQDTTLGRTAHADILRQFADKEADVLIGTQMIAKGHDFPNVTLVGILAADQLLGLSDFRASERAFQLIVQASGRAGRADEKGQVIIQAYNTDDYALEAAARQDYDAFYQQEITFRKMMKYPPIGAIGLIVLAGRQDEQVKEKIIYLQRVLEKYQTDNPDFATITVTQIARAPLAKIRDRYRWRILLYGPYKAALAEFMNNTVGRLELAPLSVTIDIDPWQML